MKRLLLCFFIFLLLSCLYAAAQDASLPQPPNALPTMGQMSQNSVSGVVRTADNRVQRNVRVELHSLASDTVIASAYTLPNGTFELDNVPRGIYEVVASSGINEARERVQVYDPNVSVTLTLPSQTADTGPLADNATVSVSQLKIPHEAKKHFVKADEAFRDQKLAKARQEVEKALHAFPAYAQALTLRGILNLQDKNFDAARADLESAIKDDASYGMSYIVLGAAYNVTRRFDDSVRVLERGTALMPASWQGHFELAKALLAKGNFTGALRHIDKAAELGPPNYAAIHLVRAHALLGLKNYDRAVTELEQFLGSEPKGADSAAARQTLDQVRAFMSANVK